jgi:ribonucleotide monophosphatase NagD (HAD superfamily)
MVFMVPQLILGGNFVRAHDEYRKFIRRYQRVQTCLLIGRSSLKKDLLKSQKPACRMLPRLNVAV